MRMRRKKNLEARLEACGDYILYLDRDEKNFQDKSNTASRTSVYAICA